MGFLNGKNAPVERGQIGHEIEGRPKEYMRLLRELADKDAEIAILRSESGIAKEAIDRFCAPEIYPLAMKWLRKKGIV